MPMTADDPGIVAAILRLTFAVDETDARYWLTQCARHGIEQPTLDDMWAAWSETNSPQTITSNPTREDPRP